MILDAIKTVLSIGGAVLGGKTGEAMKSVSGEIEGAVKANPDLERIIADKELELKRLALQDAESRRALIREEARSEDPFVRRARPAFLWLFYAIIIFNFIVFPLVKVFAPTFAFTYPDLPVPLYTLFGTAFIGYGTFRTVDKWRKNGKKSPE